MKKHLKKQVLLLFMLTAMLILPAMSALAAGTLGDVKNLKQKAVSETSVKLTWSKVKGASGYQVYRVDPASGAATKIASTKKNEPYFEENCSEYGIYISGACIRKEQGYHDGECAACYDPGADFREEAGDSVRSENCRFQ